MLSYKKILVPVDFTKISTSALAKAARHSEASDSRLFVAHIIDPTTVSTEHAVESVKQSALLKLDNLLDEAEVGYCEKEVEIGETIPTLLQIINNNEIDLVVMGTQHFNSLDEKISVTRKLGEIIECDILVLHK